MMGRVYSMVISAVAATTQVDLFELVAPSTKILELLELHLSQTTEVGDAQEEGLQILIKSGQTTSGSGGSSATPIPRQLGDTASGATAETMNTTKASAGTIVTHESHGWNIRAPFMRIWLPETTIIIPPSARLTIELGTTPAEGFGFAPGARSSAAAIRKRGSYRFHALNLC